jgi:3-deoxy-D-manno-octulosonate 8-phosphate phosphatase (KDO 8-P phosphatase)
MLLPPQEIDTRARKIRLLVLDVDGVLTDGTVAIDSQGHESKRFFIRDGAAMVWAQKLGLDIAWLSGRPSEVTLRRAHELRIKHVIQDGPDKGAGYDRLMSIVDVPDEAVAYMGDDLLDLPVISRVGLSAAPADAAEMVRQRVHWVSAAPGGHGAVREFVELLLGASDRWQGVLDLHRVPR